MTRHTDKKTTEWIVSHVSNHRLSVTATGDEMQTQVKELENGESEVLSKTISRLACCMKKLLDRIEVWRGAECMEIRIARSDLAAMDRIAKYNGFSSISVSRRILQKICYSPVHA